MQLKTLTEAVKVEFASTEYVIDGRKKVGNTLFMAAHKIVIRSLTTNEQYLEIIAQILSNGKGLEYDLGEIEASSPRAALRALMIRTIVAHIETTSPQLAAESRRRSDKY
jgi:hypothetical protein